MTELLALLLGLAGGLGIGAWLRRSGSDTGRARIYAAAESLRDFYQQSAQPADLLDHPVFKEGVEILSGKEFSTTDLLAYYTGDNDVIACMALTALGKREADRDLLEPIVAGLNNVGGWARWFALRLLDEAVEQPAASRVLAGIDQTWHNHVARPMLIAFLRRRLDRGEPLITETSLRSVPRAEIAWLEELLLEVDPEGNVTDVLREQQAGVIDVEYLRSIGQLWEAGSIRPRLPEPELNRRVHEIEALLGKPRPRPIVLVGDAGVGKTATLETAARALLERGWVVFEAGAMELLSGQIYHGQLEQRIQKLLEAIAHKPRVLWVIPDLQSMLWAGRHQFNETSILDLLLPHLESGALLVIGECTPHACERLLQSKPRLRTALDVVRIPPLGDAQTLQLAKAWIEARTPRGTAHELMTEETIRESFAIAQQYLGERSPPGNLMQLLETTVELAGGETDALSLDDVLHALSRLTGLPTSILDHREQLNLDGLRAFCHQRVLGQPEAVECLVDRVAMIKAGLTDPTRPQGVFLFAGPTGTGKTEIAKALAEFLFGSPDRMIRFDMSELQGPESLDRLLGDPRDDSDRSALVHAIRKQPFSVILLDEIEKAHPTIWDLFLQVFDDGRLTDRRGAVADFRHAIVLMTTNVGAARWQGSSLGFRGNDGHESDGVGDALAAVFRPEFLNRIDRVVAFRPLGRSVMRQILEKELDGVLQRRGLRNRQWAVEWDESALEFLLTQGFTESLGARPLRRAIERHLLSPLAVTIVNHRIPDGDQFLFVRSDGAGIQVEFIDPEAPPSEEAVEGEPYDLDEIRVERVALDGIGNREEVAYLTDLRDRITETITAESWQRERDAALARIEEPEFWDSEGRFEVLGRVEYMDRIGAGLRTADNLLTRLQRTADGRVAPELVRRLAEQLYLVRAAADGVARDRAHDAYLQIESSRTPTEHCHETAAFAQNLAVMYRNWARKRRMQLEVLSEKTGDRFESILAVSGFAAWALLEPEDGVHVLEVPLGRRDIARLRVRVSVAPQPLEPIGARPPLDVATHALAEHRQSRPRIARRYREEPSPLVRDSVRGWRTGRWDRVFGGDFDLLC